MQTISLKPYDSDVEEIEPSEEEKKRRFHAHIWPKIRNLANRACKCKLGPLERANFLSNVDKFREAIEEYGNEEMLKKFDKRVDTFEATYLSPKKESNIVYVESPMEIPSE